MQYNESLLLIAQLGLGEVNSLTYTNLWKEKGSCCCFRAIWNRLGTEVGLLLNTLFAICKCSGDYSLEWASWEGVKRAETLQGG
jgi:hypothetical protein